MFKLVAVGGKLRGEEFILEDGENVLGRDSECDVCIPVSGVSKKHLSITISSDSAYIKDLGSSNGTFINGSLVNRATLVNGDKIALPDLVLQVVFVKEKKVVVQKKIAKEEDLSFEEYLRNESEQTSLVHKIIYFFRFKFMPLIHGVNQEYEWKYLIGIILAVFCVVVITLTIAPILKDFKTILISETAKRGSHYAEEISRVNLKALEKKNLDRVDASFLEKEEGVVSYELMDLDGRIVRPLARLNEYTEDPFSAEVLEFFRKNRSSEGSRDPVKKFLTAGQIGIGHLIMAYNVSLGTFEPVGVIAIKFAPQSLADEASKSSVAYLEALVTSFIVAIFFFGVIFYLTTRPVEEMKYQIEEVLRGKRKAIESKYLMDELLPLRGSINNLLQKIRELQNEDVEEFAEMESDEEYVHILEQIKKGSLSPVIILNSEKNLSSISPEAEDITGMRESASQGMNLLDCAREKGFAATVMELCDESANSGGEGTQGSYELSGVEYDIHVTALIGKDNFAKSFYISFLRAD